MTYQLIKDEPVDYSFIILSILIGILVIYIIYPNIINQNYNEGFQIDQKVNQIIANNLPKLDQRVCSKQCCKFIQWPVPFNTKNPIVKDTVLDNFIPSNFACNGGQNGGCLCLTKDDFNYLSEHGQR